MALASLECQRQIVGSVLQPSAESGETILLYSSSRSSSFYSTRICVQPPLCFGQGLCFLRRSQSPVVVAGIVSRWRDSSSRNPHISTGCLGSLKFLSEKPIFSPVKCSQHPHSHDCCELLQESGPTSYPADKQIGTPETHLDIIPHGPHRGHPITFNLPHAPVRMPIITESFARFVSLKDFCSRLCLQKSEAHSQGFHSKQANSFPARLLCNCALMTPGLTTSVTTTQSLPMVDFVAASITLAGALGILQFFDELAKRNVLDKKLSRKLVHILSGLVFMLFWPLFSMAPQAKYMAAFAPAVNGVRMLCLGLGLWRNEALVKAVSREGSQRELLQGPLYYAISIAIVTLCFWRNSPIGAVTIANLCAGDGFADILGRKYGTVKLPYNRSKSWMGSLAFFVLASIASIGYLAYFSAFGYFEVTWRTILGTLGVSLSATIVESLPLHLDDNFSVPCTAILVGMLLLPY